MGREVDVRGATDVVVKCECVRADQRELDAETRCGIGDLLSESEFLDSRLRRCNTRPLRPRRIASRIRSSPVLACAYDEDGEADALALRCRTCGSAVFMVSMVGAREPGVKTSLRTVPKAATAGASSATGRQLSSFS